MPTVEERLAALEARMAAWIDQQPTNYYTHQYSGEEIDNAVARALPNGAIDQAAGTFVRPNLLDNWYFGRPVDQRGGYIVLQGTMTYGDVACTQAHGPVSQTALPVYMVSNQVYAIDSIHSSDGSTYYVRAEDVVRGYTGSWLYAIDRWFLGGEPSNIMMITNGGIHISYTTPGWNVIQKLKNVLCKGKTYTFSAVYKSTLPFRLVVNWGDNKYFFNEGSPATSEWALATITGTVPNDAEIAYEQVTFQQLGVVAGTMDIKAAKLEIGPTQTLAHREGDRWVINEVPEYGEQLRRCQRYCVDVAPSVIFNTMYSGFLTTTGCELLVPIPVTLRDSAAPPVVICNPSEWQVAVVAANAYFTPTSIIVAQSASGAVVLRCLFSHSLPAQYCDLRKAVDSAKLILSKDL